MSLNFSISKNVNFLHFLVDIKKEQTIKDLLKTEDVQNIELFLATENDETFWSSLEEMVGQDKLSEFRKAIAPFEQEFDKFWLTALKKLELLSKYYQDNLQTLDLVIADALSLAGMDNLSIEDIQINLVISPYDNLSAWFSWSPDRSSIVLECPVDNIIPDKFSIGILAHEFFHLILKKNHQLWEKIKKVTEKNSEIINLVNYGTKNTYLVLEELIISSFIPEGYLAEKYLGIEVVKITNERLAKTENILDFSQTRKICAYHMYGWSKKYTEGKIPLDNAYLESLIEVLKGHIQK